MNITSNYNFYSYSFPKNYAQKSFKSASDINLRYIQRNHYNHLPERIQNAVNERIKKNDDDISLRDLHLQEYQGLLDCKTLDEARNRYPEFQEVLPYEGTFVRGSKNTRKIAEKVPLTNLPLYLLQERWGKLKSMDEIVADFELQGRGSLGWITEKLKIPYFPQSYQCLLNASDEERNNIIAQKTKDFNQRHPEVVIEKNRKLSQNPKNKMMNKELADKMWNQMEHVKIEMRAHRAEHPDYNYSEFNQTFWDSHPEYKEEMSQIRREIAEERRRSKHC